MVRIAGGPSANSILISDFNFRKCPTRRRGCCSRTTANFFTLRNSVNARICNADAMQMEHMDKAARRSPVDKPPTRGGILHNRTRRAHRRRELIEVYTNALGGDTKLTDGQRVDVRKAAELVALAEDARALALQEGPGGAGLLSVLVRLEGAADRAVRRLNLPALGRAAPVQTLADYLAGRGEEG
jgi:hypothetical protein